MINTTKRSAINVGNRTKMSAINAKIIRAITKSAESEEVFYLVIHIINNLI